MEQNIESSLTQDIFGLNHDVASGECESTLERSGKYNPALQCPRNSETISLEINDIPLDFATIESTEGIDVQKDPGFVCHDDLSAPEQILEGDFGQGNELVCLETNLTNTNQQSTDTCFKNQSGRIDSLNVQECFNQKYVDVQQQNKTNNETSNPSSLFRLGQINGPPIYQNENESKPTDTKKRKNAQVHC